MTNSPEEADDILAAFAVEPNHDRETLDRYLRTYPDLTTQLLELSLELEFDDVDDCPLDLESPLVDESWARFTSSYDTSLAAANFTREVAIALGVKTVVVMQLRDRAVSFASIPDGFLQRLAVALKASVDELASYLNAPRTLALGASYRSEDGPATVEQLTLSDVMRQCGHTAEEAANLLDGG